MNHLAKAVFTAALALASTAVVHAGSAPASASPADTMSTGEVKKVDKGAGKLTIRHGELRNIGMGPMTMVFRVKDPAMLDQLKAGDRIAFVAEEPNGQLTVTRVEKQD